jgi:hypothetical protein
MAARGQTISRCWEHSLGEHCRQQGCISKTDAEDSSYEGSLTVAAEAFTM